MTRTLALVVGGYAVGMLGLAARLARRPPPAPAPAEWPRVAVVVAARDEAPRIGRCLRALFALDYPAERLEIVVADDHSADGTADVVRRVAAAAGRAVRVVAVPDPDGPLRGKAQALDAAFGTTEAEILLTTDADCAPEPAWARALVAACSDGQTGLACGFACVEGPQPFARVQALDWALLLGSTAAVAEWGLTVTGMGTSMAIRREAYYAVGGYPALPVTVTEDFTLVRAVAEQTPWRARFVVEPNATVWTLPCATVGEAFAQRRRWARGGLSGGPPVWAAYAAAWAVHALPLLAAPWAPRASAAALVAKAVADGALLWATGRRAGIRLPLAAVPALAVWTAGYLVALPAALALRPEIRWKGRLYDAPSRRARPFPRASRGSASAPL